MYIRIWLEAPHHGVKGLGHAQLAVHGREGLPTPLGGWKWQAGEERWEE